LKQFRYPLRALQGGELKSQDILSAAQFSREDIENLFQRADEFSARTEPLHVLDGKKIALMFYEPSVRTRTSFEDAMSALGGGTWAIGDANNAAGFVDAVRSIAADAIVLRHPDAGAAQVAAEASPIPVINAGDGNGEHPTQALAELYTLRAEKKTINGLRIALVGDLKNGRVAHSLGLLLAQFDVYVSLVAPAAMSMPYDLSDAMRARGITVEETNDLPRVLEKADAVILARVEKKYYDDAKKFEKMSQFYRVENIAQNKHADAWLGGTWQDGEKILAETYAKTQASALVVRMALLADILG